MLSLDFIRSYFFSNKEKMCHWRFNYAYHAFVRTVSSFHNVDRYRYGYKKKVYMYVLILRMH